ncbi:hypothetical protein BD410DRAFT_166265 [Rickenella mellea]|uniref:Uncharacterized protein n=1 Tax=Rickenella mellea TaxID=50990 RepID=A0A4Y7PJ10_9AGAM|nr:hypothetical protein BD410DRAFT_166265 [Rickenella mellea]
MSRLAQSRYLALSVQPRASCLALNVKARAIARSCSRRVCFVQQREHARNRATIRSRSRCVCFVQDRTRNCAPMRSRSQCQDSHNRASSLSKCSMCRRSNT